MPNYDVTIGKTVHFFACQKCVEYGISATGVQKLFPLEELLNFDSFYNKEGDCDNAGDTTTETRHCSNDASKDNPESQEDGPPHMDSTSDRDISGQHDHQSHKNDEESHSRASDGRSDGDAVASGSEGM